MIIINDTMINRDNIVSIEPLTKVLATTPIEVDVSDPFVDKEPIYETKIKTTYFIGVVITMNNNAKYEIGRKHIKEDGESIQDIESDSIDYVKQISSLIWSDIKIKTIKI